jgi:hypothetical protein
MNAGKTTKAESGGGATCQPPKVGHVVDPRAGLVGQRALLKNELFRLARGGTDQTDLQLKGNSAATWRKQQQF